MRNRTVNYAIEAQPRQRHELAESVLKWVWFGGLLLGLALMLTAGEGRVFRGGASKVFGWQFAQLAHGAVLYLPQMGRDVARRAAPLSVGQAWLLACCASAAMWLMIAGAVTAYVGAKRRALARWAASGAAMCLSAGLLATASTVCFFLARGIAFREGAFLFMGAPWILGTALARISVRARR